MRIKEKNSFKLLVEGNDDQHVIWSLCQHHQITENFDVIDCESINNVIKQAEIRLTTEASRNERIGIVVDADMDINKRWEQIKSILRESNKYKIPEELPLNGLIINPIDDNEPIVGVWIMPDNQLNGMLEDFVAMLSAPDDIVLKEVDQTLLKIEKDGISRYKPIHKAKARIHTFLAWQEDPGTPMGLAITKKYLAPDSPRCKPFLNWIKDLFDNI